MQKCYQKGKLIEVGCQEVQFTQMGYQGVQFMEIVHQGGIMHGNRLPRGTVYVKM